MMEASPLRSATIWCIELRPGRPVPATAIATVADVEPTRAKAYATILLAREALIETPAGLMPGARWNEWRSERGGKARTSTADPEVIEDMDAIRRAMAINVRMLAGERGWTPCELARRSGIPRYMVHRFFQRAEPLTAAATVLVARTLQVTVEQLVLRPPDFRG